MLTLQLTKISFVPNCSPALTFYLQSNFSFVGNSPSFLLYFGLLLAKGDLQIVRIENARNFLPWCTAEHHDGCRNFELIKIKELSQSLSGGVRSGGETIGFYTAYYGLQIVDCEKASFVYRKQPLPFSLWRTLKIDLR